MCVRTGSLPSDALLDEGRKNAKVDDVNLKLKITVLIGSSRKGHELCDKLIHFFISLGFVKMK